MSIDAANLNTSHALLIKLVGGSKRVLDVGCAEGDLAQALRDRGCSVSGVEIDEKAAEQARPHLDTLVVGDLADLDLVAELGAGSFDVVVLGDVLEHLADPAPTLRQAREVLAPGGRVVISIPNVAHIAVRLSLLLGRWDYRPLGLLDATHLRFFTRSTLLALLEQCGLRALEIERTTAGPFETELGVQPGEIDPVLVEQLLQDPDATTYQFVLSAGPDDDDSRLARLAVERQEAMDRVAALEREVAAARGEAQRALEAATRAEADAARQSRQVAAERKQVAELRSAQAAAVAQAQAAHAAVDIIRSSTSWRLSAPVRALNPLKDAVESAIRFRGAVRAHGGWRTAAQSARRRGLRASLQASQERSREDDEYAQWVARHSTLTAVDRAAVRRHCDALIDPPLLSVVIPTYDTGDAELRAALDSVLNQLYSHWELCVVDDASPSAAVWETLREYAARDERIRILSRPVNGGIVASTNDALGMARGEFVVLLDHDDVLPEEALYFVALEVIEHPDADLIYSDEDKLDGRGRRYGPYFKPDFNLELLLGQNMVSHLGVYRTSLLKELGGLRPGFDGSQDHDLALRVVSASAPERIRHIPRVLYHWRQYSGSGTFSSANPDRAADASRRAVQDFLDRAGETATVEPAPGFRTWNRVAFALPAPVPTVAAVVPTRDRGDLLQSCLEGLLERTDYPALEVLVVDNGSVEPDTLAYLADVDRDPRVRVLRDDSPFNYAALNNRAVEEVSADLVLLLNDDVIVESDPRWLREMVTLVSRPSIGAVGAKLLFPDGLVQHAGVILGVLGVANHAHKFVPGNDLGSNGRLGLLQEMTAVTGACLLTRRDLYMEVGGLDSSGLAIAYNDIDYCLKLRQAGWRVLWTPHAELTHVESASRGLETTPAAEARLEQESEVFRERWGPLVQADPNYNPNLTIDATDFSLADSPRIVRPWSSYL